MEGDQLNVDVEAGSIKVFYKNWSNKKIPFKLKLHPEKAPTILPQNLELPIIKEVIFKAGMALKNTKKFNDKLFYK